MLRATERGRRRRISAAPRRRALCAALACALWAAPAGAALVTWVDGNGNWNVAANWSSNPSLPGPADDVSNATVFTITHNAGADTINSFLSNGALLLNGGSLSANVPGTSPFQVNNTFTLSGGTLRGFVVSAGLAGQGITAANNGNNFLDNITLNGAPLDMSSTGITRVLNGLTLNGTATINNGSVLAFQGNQSLLGDATVVFGAAGNNRLALDGNTTLTLGPDVLIHGENANIGPAVFVGGTGRLINQGTISVDVAAGVFNLLPNSTAANSITNSGTLEAKNGGILNLNSNVTNTGVIHVGGGGSRVRQNGVRITGGTINVDAGGSFSPANSAANFLDGVTVNGEINLTATGVVRVENGLTLNGTAVLESSSVLAFQGNQSLLGSATVVFGAAANNRLALDGNTTLTLPATATLRGQNANIGPVVFVAGTGKLVNQGLISADVATGVFNLAPSSADFDSVSNASVLEAKNSAILNLNSHVTNTATGQIRADGGRVNQNGIRITGGVINVSNGGTFAPSSSGNNFLNGVTVNGDINLTAAGLERVLAGGLTLNGIAHIDGNGVLAFQGDQSLSGNATVAFGGVGGNNRLALDGNTTLTLPSTAVLRGQQANIGPAVFIGGTGKIVNQGLISVDVATGVFTLDPSSNDPDSISNAGTLEAKNGGILNLNSNVTNTGAGVIRVGAAGSRVNQNAVQITGGVINVDAAGSFAPANNGANFLSGVTVNGDINLTVPGQERIVNGLTLNGAVRINNGGVLGFQGNQSLLGDATLVFGETGGNRLSIDGNTILTLKPDVVLRGQNATIGTPVFLGGTGRLINEGLISVDVESGVFNLAPSNSALDATTNIGTLEAKNGGTLNLNNHVTNTGAGMIHVATAGSRLNQNGVQITGGVINVDAGGSFAPTNNGANFLNGVTVNGDINLSGPGQERITNGLTLNGTMHIDKSGVIGFQGDQSLLGNATLLFGAVGFNRLSLDGNTTLTLTPNVVLRGQNATIGTPVFLGGTVRLINQGLISVDVDTGVFNLAPSNSAFDSITNAGTLEAKNGGILNFNNHVTNTGAGTVHVGSTSRLNQNGVRITGGVINVDAGGLFAPINNGANFLNGVTVNGEITLTPGQERVINGLTLNGTAQINNGGVLAFEGDQSLLGNGTVLFGASAGNRLSLDGNTTLTIGPSVVLRGQNGNIGTAVYIAGTGALLNNGAISADVAGGTLRVAPSGAVRNGVTGTMEARNGGTLILDPGAGANSFVGQGMLRATTGGTLVLTGVGGSAFDNTAGAFQIDAGSAASFINNVVFNSGNVANNGAISIASGTVNLGQLGGTGATTVNGGILTVEHVRQNDLTIGSGARVNIRANGTATGTSVIEPNTLTIAGAAGAWTGKLDLTNNAIVIRSTAANKGADLARVNNQVKTGLAEASGNFWSGNGITSSTAAANSGGILTAVGVILNDFAQVPGLPAGPIVTEFSGQTVNENDILAKYTYFGDADLSGFVDATDYSLIDNAFNLALLNGGWLNGDFNYDGVVDATDYSLIDNAFNSQTVVLAGSAASAVPEPSLAGLLMGAGLLSRRRRRA